MSDIPLYVLLQKNVCFNCFFFLILLPPLDGSRHTEIKCAEHVLFHQSIFPPELLLSPLLRSVLWEQRDPESRKTLLKTLFLSFPLARVQRVKPAHGRTHTHARRVHTQARNFKEPAPAHGALETNDRASANLAPANGRRLWRAAPHAAPAQHAVGGARMAAAGSCARKASAPRPPPPIRRGGGGRKRQLEEGSFKTPTRSQISLRL